MLLLDSQVALWLIDDNPRLGQRPRQRIDKAEIVLVSAGTIWELTIKAMLGKLFLPEEFNQLLTARASRHCRSPPVTRLGSSTSPSCFDTIRSIDCSCPRPDSSVSSC